MLNIIICGINGKMGNQVYQSAIKRGHTVVCGIDKKTLGNTECPTYKSFEEIKNFADAIVDFSSPCATGEVLNYAITNKVPVVIGTTGHDANQEEMILSASKEIPIFKSANTALAINLLLKLCSICAQTLKGSDVEIVEKHHKYKKDSPSGTANLIYNTINSALNFTTLPIYGRKGEGIKKQNEIGIHSLRGGTTVGEHTIYFFGENESITITHTAYSKEIFADGAIKATEFIINKKNGLYDMNNLIEQI